MEKEFDNLIQGAEQAEALSNQVKDWMAFNISEEEFPSEAKKLNRIARELRSVQRAAGQRPSIFLFGISQVGKSYLVHNIAKHPETGRCEVCAGAGNRVDFIDQINPPGGNKESTGISTRFRVGPEPADANYPFKAKLFNAVDVAAIAVNSYFNDLDQSKRSAEMELSESEVQEWMRQARMKAGASAQQGMSQDALAYFVEYCEMSYSNRAEVALLKRMGFFEVVLETMSSLDFNLRIQGLSFLWGGLSFWTEFVSRMWRTLDGLNHSSEVDLPVDSIVSHDSLVNVKLMNELLAGDGEQIILKQGQRVLRSELAFLIRELELVLPEEVAVGLGECLKSADLVDFPGARSRLNLDVKSLKSTSASEQENQTLCIRRGKVAYLFDLYNQELEIGCLLFCMDDGQPEVQTIPGLIQDWIHRNIGENAAERKGFASGLKTTLSQQGLPVPGEVNPLFAVLTKFNRSMMPIEGKSTFDSQGEEERIQGRFEANFTDWLQTDASDKWLNNWDGQAFQNVYPVRDPAHSKNFFKGYEETGKENDYVDGAEAKLNNMGQVFINSEAVKARIASPQQVWTQLTQPNKTGIEELLANVTPAAHPALKLAQVKTLLSKSLKELQSVAAKHHVAGDLEQELAKAQEMGGKARRELVSFRLPAQRKKLVALMSAMSCSNEMGIRAYNQTYLNEHDATPSNQRSEGGLSWDQFAESLGITLEGDAEPASQIAESMGMDEQTLRDWMGKKGVVISTPKATQRTSQPARHDSFGSRLIASWITEISEWLNEDFARSKGWTADEHEFIKAYVHSIIEGRVRSQIQQAISSAVTADFAQPQPNEATAWHASTVGSRIINQYVSSFGLVHESAAIPANQDAVKRKAGSSGYWNVWTKNLQRSFEENVRHQFDAPDDGRLESNKKLGDLLGQIDSISTQMNP